MKEKKEAKREQAELNADWVHQFQIEHRNCGKARAAAMFVTVPEDVQGGHAIPTYGQLVSLATDMFLGAVGNRQGHDWFLVDADVMAWSKYDTAICVPTDYRVNLTFKEREDVEKDEEE